MLAVNGASLSGSSHAEAIAAFKSVRQGQVTLTIGRRNKRKTSQQTNEQRRTPLQTAAQQTTDHQMSDSSSGHTASLSTHVASAAGNQLADPRLIKSFLHTHSVDGAFPSQARNHPPSTTNDGAAQSSPYSALPGTATRQIEQKTALLEV